MAATVKPSPGRKSDKRWRDAISIAVQEKVSGKQTTKLRAMADALVEKALEGDVPALKEVGDRLDGKAAQYIESSQEVTHRYVMEVPAGATDETLTPETWQQQHSNGKTLQ